MKTKLVTLISIAALSAVSNGAISLSATALRNVQGSSGTDLPAGRLGLLVVDLEGNGFLNGLIPATGINNNLLAISDPGLESLQAGLTVNSTFGGDTVIARLSTTVFGDTTIAGVLTGFDNTATYQGKSFAIIWFDTLLNSGVETLAPGSTDYGIARGADWTLPLANSGGYTFGTGGTNLDQITLGATATAAAGQAVNFATNGTSFSVVPEPSAALLGALGALALLRRRRI